ncbi:MAG: hypothetical protein O2800_02495 [Planctomycetota bacterium]|nr:hypothetical protein [Planctomycetota bacterium]
MKQQTIPSRFRAVRCVALIVGALALASPSAMAQGQQGIPPIPATPARVGEIVWARPFTVEVPWASDWRADHPTTSCGWIVVLRAESGMCFPRQVASPVLMANDMPVEVIEPVQGGTLVVAIVRADPNAQSLPNVALSSITLWWSAPALPEQITAAAAQESWNAASQGGMKPVDERAATKALDAGAKGVGPLQAKDRQELSDAALAARLAFEPVVR